MNINYKKFNKKIICEDDNYFLEVTINNKFKEMNYVLIGKENVIQQGTLKKYKKNKKIKFLLETFETVNFIVKINNSFSYYEILDKEDLNKMKLDIKNKKNIEIDIEKKNIEEINNINNLINDFSIMNKKSICEDDEIINDEDEENNTNEEDSEENDSEENDSEENDDSKEKNSESW